MLTNKLRSNFLSHWVSHSSSLRIRRLEVVGTRKNGRGSFTLKIVFWLVLRFGQPNGLAAQRESPSRAVVLSFAHYFQAPATQAITPAGKGTNNITHSTNY